MIYAFHVILRIYFVFNSLVYEWCDTLKACLFLCFKNIFEILLLFSLLEINMFLVFSNCYDMMISKIKIQIILMYF